MTARVLVVDDSPTNVKLLEARLSAEYFEVLTAFSGSEALAICQKADCDIVLLDVMMPEMDGFEVCRQLKGAPSTQHIPVLMVTALDQPSDRLRGLQAGADDFLTKPVSEIELIARVRSLTRLKLMTDELRMRVITARDVGAADPEREADVDPGTGGRILVVDDRMASCERIVRTLEDTHTVEIELDPAEALFHAAERDFDLLIVSLNLKDFDGLRLCSQIRALDRTRHLPMLVIADPDDKPRLLRALEIGANDCLVRPIDKNELMARVLTQVRKQRYAERLRDSLHTSMAAAVTDGLTGLFNRRYLDGQIGGLVEQASARGKPLAMLVLDIDHFRSINDAHGHEAGDDVLREFGIRVRKSIRGIDLACRTGGEEFVIVMPETDLAVAVRVAERLRRRIATEAFPIRQGAVSVDVTTSIGLAGLGRNDTPAAILKRADVALYQAKREGRNRVVPDAA
jgi:two-component system cell cycle response regulator